MKKSQQNHRKYIYVLIALAFFTGLRIAAPYFLEYKIVSTINSTENYHIQIEDVDLALYKGGVCIQNVILTELNSAEPETPFVELNALDFNIEWKSLFKGHVVGELYVDSLELNLVVRPDSLVSDSLDERFVLADLLLGLNPLSINHAELNYGKTSYKDPFADPPVEIYLDHIDLFAENLNNVEVFKDSLPGIFQLSATTIDSTASLQLEAHVNLLKEVPDLDLELELVDYQLTELNPLLKNTANFDVHHGVLSVYSEASVKDSYLIGYVKPFIEDIEIKGPEEKGSLLNRAYEGILDIGFNLLQNRNTEKIATKVPIEGQVENSDPEEWTAFFNTIKNAFIKAFKEELDHSIEYYERGE